MSRQLVARPAIRESRKARRRQWMRDTVRCLAAQCGTVGNPSCLCWATMCRPKVAMKQEDDGESSDARAPHGSERWFHGAIPLAVIALTCSTPTRRCGDRWQARTRTAWRGWGASRSTSTVSTVGLYSKPLFANYNGTPMQFMTQIGLVASRPGS